MSPIRPGGVDPSTGDASEPAVDPPPVETGEGAAEPTDSGRGLRGRRERRAAEPGARRGRPHRSLLVAAPLCLLAFLSCVIMTSLWLHERGRSADVRTERAASLDLRSGYVDTATRVMTHLMTIRQDTLRQDVDRITGEIEGDFAQQFTPRRDSFEEVVKTTKVIADGEIVAAGVEKQDTDRADVLVAVDQRITNPTTNSPEKRSYRMRITVNRHSDGTMKVSGVNFVP